MYIKWPSRFADTHYAIPVTDRLKHGYLLALQLIYLLDRRAHEKLSKMTWTNPSAERRSLLNSKIMKQVGVKLALQRLSTKTTTTPH